MWDDDDDHGQLWKHGLLHQVLHMGQFPEDGNFGRFMSNFFLSRRLLLQNQWILTTSIDLC